MMRLSTALTRLILTVFIGLQWLIQVSALKGDSGCGTYLCINATLSGDTVTYEVTALKEPLGWVAIGFGRKMKDTHMVIMWPNSDGSQTLSQRYATGHREPVTVEDPPRVATLVDSTIASWHPANSTSFTFDIPANQTLLASSTPRERLIWAYSKTRPAKFPDSVLMPHYMAGFFSLDLTKDLPEPIATNVPSEDINIHRPWWQVVNDTTDITTSVTPSSPYGNQEKLIIAHGILLSTGFLVLLPAGSLIARWGRTVTPSWFKAHWICNMLLALPVITIGWLAGPAAVISHQGAHLVDAHQVCGVFLVLIYYLQISLGRYIHRRRAAQGGPVTRPHPPSNVLHVFLGLSIICLAFFQVCSGMKEWQFATARPAVARWIHDLWLAWAVILPLGYASGLTLLRRQFFQERQGISTGQENYIALSDGTASPTTELLHEIHEDNYEADEKPGEYMHSLASAETVHMNF